MEVSCDDESDRCMHLVGELAEWKPAAWRRKILRSKKLTKLLLPRQTYALVPMAEYCRSHGVACDVWLPAQALPSNMPTVVVGEQAVLRSARPEDVVHPPVIHRVLDDVLIRSRSNLLQVDGTLVHDDMVRVASDRLPEEYHRGVVVMPHVPAIQKARTSVRVHPLEEALSLLDATATNYSHWLTEILPKAALWCHHASEQRAPLLVDSGLHPNIMRSLELMLPDDAPVIQVPRGQEVCVRRLHHVSSPGHIPFEPRSGSPRSHGTFSTPALDISVQRIKRRLNLLDTDAMRGVIYVRRNAGLRNVQNVDELDALAAQQGWTTVSPERLSFDEQVRVFHSARLVIGATGAAMANLIFCRPGARVAVMMSKLAETPYFYWHNMALCRDVCVEYILCEPDCSGNDGVHANFAAPIAAMAQAYRHERVA